MATGGSLMLLDTCALLWLASGSKELSARARARIDGAAEVYVSAITGFEIALKCGAGKLRLPVGPSEWFKNVLGHHNVSVAPLDLEICTLAAELPHIHRDPCDRFIIATATLNDWPVVTGDQNFRKYGVETLV
ncbi:MAG: PIN domain nuclease [Verrucomicrobia bacterium]|nr:PIN domain nuclease [Verrucomicrobiota bacterium]